ncbi:MAG: DUF342 domain-containing protein [Oscillospiraceae bacterium]
MLEENFNTPVDAYVDITIEADKRSAYMVIHAPKYGGEFVSPEDIENEIESSGVVFGLEDMERIQKAVKVIGCDHRITIANWKPPIDGENGYVEYHFNPDKVAKPTEDEHGDVDFKDLGLVTNIFRGTKIATVHEPTPGEEGYNVLGEMVEQKPGSPANVTLGSGTELSPDGHYIVAAVDGNLVFQNGSFVVNEDLNISGDVGFSTGNIDFIGNVIIGGNVFEGFKVTSKKNVTIRGAATSAEIIAGGDVSIRLGCLQSRVDCKGSFKADFCENSRIKGRGDVQANSFVGCEVFTEGKIIATGKSIISGGSYTAMENIEASVIGSNSYIKTDITVGSNAVLTAERGKAVVRADKLEAAVAQLTKVIEILTEKQKQGETLSPKHEQMKSESLRTKIMTQNEIKKIYARMEEIDEELSHKQNISITCKKRFYPGTTIRIDAYTYTVTAVYENSKATVLDDKIVMVPA